MTASELLALYDQKERLDAIFPGVRREVDSPIVAKHGFQLLTRAYECIWEPPQK